MSDRIIELASSGGKPAAEVRTPRYVRVHPDGTISWTADKDAAARFPDDNAAEAFASARLSGDVRIVKAPPAMALGRWR